MTRLKSLISVIFFSVTPLLSHAQFFSKSELRIGIISAAPFKNNYGGQVELAFPLGKLFELTPSVFGVLNTYTGKIGYYDCMVGEPILVSKQRYALHQSIEKANSIIPTLGIAIKPFAKISQKHDLAIGLNIGYGYFQDKMIGKIETEEGTFIPYSEENFLNGWSFGGVLQARYAYAISNKSKIGIRYMTDPALYNPHGAWSIYYGFKLKN